MLSSHLLGDAYPNCNLIEKARQVHADGDSWSRIARELGEHPALVTTADTESGVDLGVSTFRNLLSEVSALGHQALAVDRTKQEVLQGVSPRIQLPAELATDLRDGAAIRRHGPFAVFLATYAVVLARLTGRADVVVGVPLANRRKARERQAFGYFVNTLPMPLNLAAHKTFEDLVATVAARVFTLLRHQQFDLGAHADAIFGRAPTGPVAVDNAFTYYKQRLVPEFDGRQAQAIAVPRTLIKYPFGMNVEDQGDGYLVNLEYLSRLSAADPAACVLQVLGTVAADPAVCLADLAILSPDHEQALVDLAGTAKDFDTPASLDAWFRSAAAGRPDAPAVCDAEGTLSYADLDAAADLVASTVRRLTSGPAVAVAMHRSRHLIAVILGVLRAGKCYVPIDPAAPPERARHIVGQFDDLLLVSDHAALAVVDGFRRVDSSEVLSEIEHPAEGAPAPAEEPDGKDFRDEVAYVIFTSGSTGVPKGVEVTHRNVMRLFRSAEEHFDFGPQDTWCLFHSYAFDFSVWEIFGALLYGGRLVVVPELTARSPDAFADLLVREKVTVLNQTPSAFRRLTSVLGPRADLAVRWIVFGGEALHVDILQPWLAAHPSSARLVNMYGITETTVHVTFHEVDPATVGTQSESVIGRALGDLTVTVVDRDLHRCPVGVQGEILVSGAGLARGYRNRPDLTAERFLRGTRYGEVVYRTGDLGVLRADGTLVYLGRIDKQVQLRGYRIELGEVEAGLLAVAGVRECAVTLDEPRGGEPRLVAYVVGENVPD
ncbi:MAG TPA: amino acid adenylation domain-containing protein, partial [Mycobacterium sp.]